MKEKHTVRNGVFADLESAVLDRVDLSITAEIKRRPWQHLIETANKPALGKNSFYARFSNGELGPTHNPYQLQYAKVTHLPLVPQAVLRLDSERTPLSVAEILLGARSLTDFPYAVKVAYVEIAFDLFGLYDELEHALVSTVTQRRKKYHNKENGLRSLYLGSPLSERYACLYEKPPAVAPGVVRLEIRLDSRALRRLHIVHPEELLTLRNVDFTRLVSFCRLRVPAAVKQHWQQNAWCYLAERSTIDVFAKEFAEYYPRSEFLRPISVDRNIRHMQGRLIC